MMIIELVLNNFINTRVKTKSKDRLSDMFIGHASKPYSNASTHFMFTRCKITSSEAIRPILPNIELNDRYYLQLFEFYTSSSQILTRAKF